jgi:hypothetical protein
MRIILIIFNVVEYVVFVTTVFLLSLPALSDSSVGVKFAGFAAIGRDFSLGLVFVVFVIALKIGLSDSPPGSETVDERRLILFTIVLSVFLLLRGSVTLVQGLVVVSQPSECTGYFLTVFTVVEVLIEGGPFIFLIRVNNNFFTANDDTEKTGRALFDGLAS